MQTLGGGFMIAPFLSAIAYSLGTIVDKVAVSKRNIQLRHYVPYLFLYLFFFSALASPFFGYVNWKLLLAPQFIFLFLVMILLAVTWNIFYYESLKKEKLMEFESIIMFVPLVTVALSWVFFPETWQLKVGGAALVAATALIWSHWDNHHIRFDHYSLNLLVAVLLMATEDIIATELLRDQVISPVSLYALRTFILFAFFFAYYRPKVEKIDPKSLNIIGLAGLLGALFMIFRYYGYQKTGIPFTSLVSIAAPITVYIGSATVLRERQKPKVIIATGIVALAIVYATSVLAN